MSSNLYSLNKTILSPSSMDFCIEASFVQPNGVNLIVSRSNTLSIYQVIEIPNVKKKHDNDGDQGNKINQIDQEQIDYINIAARLVHVTDYKLHGRIVSMDVVRTQSTNGLMGMDSILLSFSEAKMSLLEWSPELHSVQTVSIHYYEREEFRKISATKFYDPRIRVDHQSRCAIMQFYTDRLAIIPFKQDSSIDANDFTHQTSHTINSAVEDSSKKQPYLPSIVVPFSTIDPQLKNIQDFCFLYDYFEPTMAILYEPQETWTGRLAAKQDTKCLMVVSVDAGTKKFPILYRLENIPYNAFKIIPVPGPTGGILILTPNGIIHVDQTSIPGIAMSVNKYFGKEKEIKINKTTAQDDHSMKHDYYGKLTVSDYSHLELFLGDCQLSFLNPDTALLALNDGRMFTLRLENNEAQTGFSRLKSGVTSFYLDQLDGLQTSRPSSLCRLGVGFIPDSAQKRPRIMGSLCSKSTPKTAKFVQLGYVFVGSSLENGHLIQFVEHPLRKHSESTFTAFGEANLMDDDLDDIYGTGSKSPTANLADSNYMDQEVSNDKMPQFQFRLVDYIQSHGTIKDMTVGKPARYSSYSFLPTHTHADLEVVTLGGADPHGHLVVLQRNFRPRILSSFDMPDVLDVWSVRIKNKSLFTEDTPTDHHDFLFLTKSDMTTVLKTAEDIQELEKQYFYRQDRTVGVSAVLSEEFILQVARKQVFLYDRSITLLSSVEVDDQNPVCRCAIADKYALLQFDSGHIALLNINDSGLTLSEMMDWQVSCSNIYTNEDAEVHLWIVDENGSLKVYDENLNEVMFFENFVDFPDVLQPNEEMMMSVSGDVDKHNATSNESIVDICLVNVPTYNEDMDTFLMVKTAQDQLIIYKQFGDRKRLKFYRIPHEELAHQLGSEVSDHFGTMADAADDKNDSSMEEVDDVVQDNEAAATQIWQNRSLFPFYSIGSHGYTGVFVAGKRPLVVILKRENDILENLNTKSENEENLVSMTPLSSVARNQVRIHPFYLDGSIGTFTEFKNVHCEDGFIYFNDKGAMRITTLIDHFSYDTEWPMARIKLPYNPEFIAFHSRSETYVVGCATEAKFYLSKAKHAAALTSGVSDVWEEQNKQETNEHVQGLYEPKVHDFKLALISPITWEIVDLFEFTEYEHILDMISTQMNTKQTESGKKEYVAVGTGYVRGEDLACRGRTLLFDVIDVVPEPDNPQTNHKLKKVCVNDEKAHVSALSSTSGALVCGIGSRVIVQAIDDDEELSAIAFIDVNFYVTSLSAAKNLIIVGDVMKGVSFVGLQEEPPKLLLLGKDYHPLTLLSTEFLIDGSLLGMIAADDDRNLHVLQYQPYHFQSMNGQKLLRRGDFHCDKFVGKWIRMKRIVDERRPKYTKTYFSLGSTFEGALIVMTPVPENLYRRLYALYSRMVYKLQHLAGLNPRGYRQVRLNKKVISSAFVGAGSGTNVGPPGPRMVLDGDFIVQFLQLRQSMQNELSKSIGSEQSTVKNDLLEVFQGMEYF